MVKLKHMAYCNSFIQIQFYYSTQIHFSHIAMKKYSNIRHNTYIDQYMKDLTSISSVAV